MKRSINLLAALDLEGDPPPSPWRVLTVVGGALVVPVLVWGIHARAASRLDPQVVDMRTQRDQLIREGDQIRLSIGELQAQIARRKAEQARADEIHWNETFRELSHVVPSGVWLSDLGKSTEASLLADSGREDMALQMHGVAVSQRVVADLLANLEQSEYFADPLVIYTQRAAGPGIVHVEFSVQCLLRRNTLSAATEGPPA